MQTSKGTGTYDDYNELDPRTQSVISLNPFPGSVSASRAQMLATQLGQKLTVSGACPRAIQTGTEMDYGKYTFRVEMPCDGVILKVIDRYPFTMGEGAIQHNPERIVIYEEVGTRRVGHLVLPYHHSYHQYFGFRYTRTEHYDKIAKDAYFKAGTVFLDSPAITDEKDYAYGVEANVAFYNDPATSEDGMKVSDEFMRKLSFNTYEVREIEWGNSFYALNMYPSRSGEYGCFPEVGAWVRDDGVVMALRPYDLPELAIVERSAQACTDYDAVFDRVIYAPPGGRVVDVQVIHNLQNSNIAPKHADSQPQRYDRAYRTYCKELIDFYDGLCRQRGTKTPDITPQFHRLIADAEAVRVDEGRYRVEKIYHKIPMDIYRVRIVIEYEITPTRGFKATGCYGNKGVFCSVVPKEMMPVDEQGNRADVLMASDSINNRAIPAVLFEHYFNAASRDCYKKLCEMLNLSRGTPVLVGLEELQALNPARVDEAFNYLLGYYAMYGQENQEIIDTILSKLDEEGRNRYLAEVIYGGKHHGCVTVWLPTNHQKADPRIVMDIENSVYRPFRGKVTYKNTDGEMVTSVSDVFIASSYIMLLEKIADDWTAASSAKRQVHGAIAPLTKVDKYTSPVSEQGGRVTGEAERRNDTANCGSRYAAEFHDRNANPMTHRAIVENILKAENPSNVEQLVDRVKHPLGYSVPHQLVNHTLQVGGIEFAYAKYDPEQRGIGLTGEEADDGLVEDSDD